MGRHWRKHSPSNQPSNVIYLPAAICTSGCNKVFSTTDDDRKRGPGRVGKNHKPPRGHSDKTLEREEQYDTIIHHWVASRDLQVTYNTIFRVDTVTVWSEVGATPLSARLASIAASGSICRDTVGRRTHRTAEIWESYAKFAVRSGWSALLNAFTSSLPLRHLPLLRWSSRGRGDGWGSARAGPALRRRL